MNRATDNFGLEGQMTNLVGDENVVLQLDVRQAAETCAAQYHLGDRSANTFGSGMEPVWARLTSFKAEGQVCGNAKPRSL